MKVIAGIDVGKRSLDVSVSAGPARRFDNTPAGRTALVEWLEGQGATEVVCEPTGGYERPLVRRVQATGRPIHIVHPNRVRHFARAAGNPAKTDALDAQRLARYGMAFALPRPLAKEADREVVQDLLRRRKQTAGVSLDPGRTRHRAEGVVLSRLGGDPLQRRPQAVLSTTVYPGQDRQGGPGRGDAEAAAGAQRHCPARLPVGPTPRPSRPQKGLTRNTDTPAQAGIHKSVLSRKTVPPCPDTGRQPTKASCPSN